MINKIQHIVFAFAMAQPIRILCLHGFCSTAGHLEGSLKALQKRMSNVSPSIELHFLQAPRRLPIRDDVRRRGLEMGKSLDQMQRYSWWNASDDGKEYRGWKDSVAYVLEFINDNGPFHGILGFSQGALMAAVVCASIPTTSNNNLSFAIIIGGFPPRDPELQALIKESSAIQQLPSLHVIGEADELVKPEISRQLAQHFHKPSFLLHPGGHYIPTSRSHSEQLIDFAILSIQYC